MLRGATGTFFGHGRFPKQQLDMYLGPLYATAGVIVPPFSTHGLSNPEDDTLLPPHCITHLQWHGEAEGTF